MTRRTALAIIGAVLLLALVLWLARSGPEEAPLATSDASTAEVLEVPIDPRDVSTVAIYFPDNNGLLSAEEKNVANWATAEAGAQRVLEALMTGPESERLFAPLPAEVTLGTVHLSPESVLYVDLASKTLSSPPTTGSQMELMTVYSLVNTVMLAIPEIESVVLLWNGRQPPSFGGHVDTSLPLRADRDLIRTRR
jgi:hypothetical protein